MVKTEWRKIISVGEFVLCAKMFVKLIPSGSNSPSFYEQLFKCTDPKRAKRHWQLDCLSALFGSAHVKAACKHVCEIDPIRCFPLSPCIAERSISPCTTNTKILVSLVEAVC